MLKLMKLKVVKKVVESVFTQKKRKRPLKDIPRLKIQIPQTVKLLNRRPMKMMGRQTQNIKLCNPFRTRMKTLEHPLDLQQPEHRLVAVDSNILAGRPRKYPH
jgi:hypothetical protein